MRTSARARDRFVKGVAVLIAACGVAFGSTSGSTTIAPGVSLQQALIALQEQGVKVIYSSRVVGPELTVRSRAGSSEPRKVLEELLAPHGLVAEAAPVGWFVIKRARIAHVLGRGDLSTPGDSDGPISIGAPFLRVEEELTVSPLIWIPVQVLRNGAPARGLGIEDFEVFVRRQRVPIADFRVLGPARRFEAETDLPSPAEGTWRGRRFVFFLDLLDAPVPSLQRARQAAFDVLESTFEPGDLGLVAAYLPLQGFRLVQGFTPDRDRLRVAIRLATRGPGESPGRDERIVDTEGAGASDPAFVNAAAGQKSTKQSHDASIAPPEAESDSRIASQVTLPPDAEKDVLQRTLGLLEGIEAVGTVATAVPGSTHLLLLSPGFDTTSITGLGGATDAERGRLGRINSASLGGEHWSVDSELRFGSSWALRRYRRCVDNLRERGCRVHGLHTGIGPPRGGAGLAGSAGLAWLAEQTGGTFSSDPVQFLTDLGATLQKDSGSYLLGVSVGANRPKGSPKLRVKLVEGGPDDVLSHPARLPRARDEVSAGAEQTLLAMEALTSLADGGTFDSEVRITAGDSLTSSGQRLQLFVDAPSLLETAAAMPVLTLDVWAYAISSTGEWTQLARRRFSLDLDRVTPRQLGTVLKLEEPFELPTGEYVVRTLIQNGDSGAMSLSSASFELR